MARPYSSGLGIAELPERRPGSARTVPLSAHAWPPLHAAGFPEVEIENSQRTLRLPAPESFLWQYIHSTPLAGPVGAASDAQRAALQGELIPRWGEYRVDGGMELRLEMNAVLAR